MLRSPNDGSCTTHDERSAGGFAKTGSLVHCGAREDAGPFVGSGGGGQLAGGYVWSLAVRRDAGGDAGRGGDSDWYQPVERCGRRGERCGWARTAGTAQADFSGLAECRKCAPGRSRGLCGGGFVWALPDGTRWLADCCHRIGISGAWILLFDGSASLVGNTFG